MSKELTEKEIREVLEKRYYSAYDFKALAYEYLRCIKKHYRDVEKGLENKNLIVKTDPLFPDEKATIETVITKIKEQQQILDIIIEMWRVKEKEEQEGISKNDNKEKEDDSDNF